MAEPILSIDKLSVGYTDEPVVVDFSIAIAAGSITTIIGPNGAGKSTLLRAIYGLNRYFSGTSASAAQPSSACPPRNG